MGLLPVLVDIAFAHRTGSGVTMDVVTLLHEVVKNGSAEDSIAWLATDARPILSLLMAQFDEMENYADVAEAICRLLLEIIGLIRVRAKPSLGLRVRHNVAIYGQLLLFCDQSMREKAWRSRKRGA